MTYQIRATLDLGDLGQVEATVDGAVLDVCLFGDRSGYHQTTIDKVIAHIPVYPKSARTTELDVTYLINKACCASICEELENVHDSERRGA